MVSPIAATALAVLAACAGAGGSSPPAQSLALRPLAPGVYAAPGDSGRGSEGRANAGVVTADEGVLVVDALGSPRQGERLLAAIRAETDRPLRGLVLTHHHPDHHFGAAALRGGGAPVLAHPDRATAAAEAGDAELAAAWASVVGEEEMRGFAPANAPDVPIERDTVLTLGSRDIHLLVFPNAHTPGDVAVWLPAERVLFAGDLLVEDGVTMLVDGDSGVLLHALDRLEALGPAVVVPGHGTITREPAALFAATRTYVEDLRREMRDAVRAGKPLRAVLAELPPAEEGRAVSRASRVRRNAVRVYLEMEREAMELDAARSPIGTAELAALLEAGDAVSLLDVRTDIAVYLRGHVPGAAYLNVETLRSTLGGVPNLLLPLESYRTLFSRLGLTLERPVVIYGSGEARNIDATYVAWILAGLGHRSVRVLDGGFGKWQLEDRPVSRRYPHGVSSRFEPAAFAPERASLDDVRAALGRPDVLLVDARPPEQYAGLEGPQLRRGHIPGAVNHFWQSDLVEGEFARVWKDSSALREAYVAQGITPDKRIIAYCNGGLESSHVHFTLRWILDYPDVRVYDGSFTEWSEREELPVESGSE